ncbi:MAG: hypothetical protein HY785_04860 [Oscillatoriophycideae cyanobacterium NC_groundwater_1537_Pr4_S-0.65um_50_18]|nr:hypothetical protein [Oscillatoriophycideae cyanobacterium NC_groundwater_1537_Pr4_S-0.65um_50_18]
MSLQNSLSEYRVTQSSFPTFDNKQRPISFESKNRQRNTHPLFRASDNDSSLRLQVRRFTQDNTTLYASRTTSFTRIEPSSLIQNRLAANVQTSDINFIYVGKVPQLVRAAFQYAANIWQTLIYSSIPIQIRVTWKKDNPSTLGSSGITYGVRNFPSFRRNTWYGPALANAISGRDLAPKLPDALINLNSRQRWYLGTDGRVPQGQYDMATVAMHEIYHALASPRLLKYNPTTGQGSGGVGGYPGLYDRFVVNGSGQSLLNTRRFPNPSKALGRQLTGNNLFFNGTHAIKANAGQPPKLFAPRRWEPGSSYAHLDEKTYPAGSPNSLNTPYFGASEAIHDPGLIVLGILQDMGWVTMPD